ncbi:hypothetical protein D3C86_2089840 [compost metagenome]
MFLLYRASKLPAPLLAMIAPAPGLILAAWLSTLLPEGSAKVVVGACLALVSLAWSWHAAPEELRGLVVKLSTRLRFA